MTLITLLFSLSVFALEIQCSTNHAGVEAAIKTSENSGQTYVVFFEGEQVVPFPLVGELSISDAAIVYQSENMQLNFNRIKMSGEFVIGETQILLSNCKNTDI